MITVVMRHSRRQTWHVPRIHRILLTRVSKRPIAIVGGLSGHGLLHDPEHTRPLIANYVRGYEAVTAQQVRDVIKRRVDGKIPLTIEVVPEGAH